MILDEIFERRPEWVDRSISPTAARLLANEITKANARTAIEVGVASGFSSAVIWSALKTNTDTPRLYSFDLSTPLYYDASRRTGNHEHAGKKTGDAFYEVHGEQPGFTLKTGIISADIHVPELVDFVHIDANHRSPWPALDLLSVSRFLRPGAVIALDDVEMPITTKWKDTNGARDLYRAWLGKKWRYPEEPNTGFLRYGGTSALAASLRAAILPDWDLKVPKLERYAQLTGHLPLLRRILFLRALRGRAQSKEVMRESQ